MLKPVPSDPATIPVPVPPGWNVLINHPTTIILSGPTTLKGWHAYRTSRNVTAVVRIRLDTAGKLPRTTHCRMSYEFFDRTSGTWVPDYTQSMRKTDSIFLWLLQGAP